MIATPQNRMISSLKVNETVWSTKVLVVPQGIDDGYGMDKKSGKIRKIFVMDEDVYVNDK
jgi:hypothetical protein